jgi:hypothetical protein
MLTTTEPLRPVDDPAAREAAVRADLNAQAAHVMNTSQPTPTQAEMDAIRNGVHRPREVGVAAPAMPPVHEQRARLAHAATPLYDTRQITAATPADVAAAALERARLGAEAEAAEARQHAERADAARDERETAPAKKL